jgi:hypothetical protein
MRGILTALAAELAQLYFKFLLLAPGKVVVLVLADGATKGYMYSISHNY